MITLISWLGNIFIIAGLWGIGNKDRDAFIASVIGESCWMIASFVTGNWALLFMCSIFAMLAVRNYYLWQ